MTAGSP
jgi:hypothetical protein